MTTVNAVRKNTQGSDGDAPIAASFRVERCPSTPGFAGILATQPPSFSRSKAASIIFIASGQRSIHANHGAQQLSRQFPSYLSFAGPLMVRLSARRPAARYNPAVRALADRANAIAVSNQCTLRTRKFGNFQFSENFFYIASLDLLGTGRPPGQPWPSRLR
jgi:hypothetical protein